MQQEFTDNLTGVIADDEKTFVVDYPEDFSSKGLAGKKVEYTGESKRGARQGTSRTGRRMGQKPG